MATAVPTAEVLVLAPWELKAMLARVFARGQAVGKDAPNPYEKDDDEGRTEGTRCSVEHAA